MSFTPEYLLSSAARDTFITKIKEVPDLIDPKLNLKFKASVLVPLFVQNGEIHVLYTVRSSNLRAHSGQVSFPGGKMEEKEGVVETALREAEEEIGLPRNTVDIWYVMDPIPDNTTIITPVIGLIKDLDIKTLQPNINEVKEIFSVPISALCDTENHGHLVYKGLSLPLYMYGKYKIWGTTGFITHLFLLSFLTSELYIHNFERQVFDFEELLASKL